MHYNLFTKVNLDVNSNIDSKTLKVMMTSQYWIIYNRNGPQLNEYWKANLIIYIL